MHAGPRPSAFAVSNKCQKMSDGQSGNFWTSLADMEAARCNTRATFPCFCRCDNYPDIVKIRG